MVNFGGFLRNVSQVAQQAAPIIGAAGALSGGGQAATLARVAAASSILGGAAPKVQPTSFMPPPRTSTGQQQAVPVPPEPPRESAMSGERMQMRPGFQPATYVPPSPVPVGVQKANLPAVVAGAQVATRAVGGIGGMLGLAGGALAIAPIIIDPFTGEEKKLRVTRRLKSQVRKAVELMGIEATAQAMGTDVEVVVYILTKKMRNDGPYVTKAAVRKTRATIRKMKGLCDMYDDLRPAAKRRAPARRASATTLIKN